MKTRSKGIVAIEVCESDSNKATAHEQDTVIWTNNNHTKCSVNFNIDGSPFTRRSFEVDPFSFKVTHVKKGSGAPGSGKTYHYSGSRCSPKQGGQPIVIIQ
jgi:hypothetical protein